MKKVFSLFAVTIFVMSSLTNVVYAKSNANEHRTKTVAHDNMHINDKTESTHNHDDNSYHIKPDGHGKNNKKTHYGTKKVES